MSANWVAHLLFGLIVSLSGLAFFRAHAPHIRRIGDFSLNVTNSLTAAHLFDWGLDTLTAAHDLDESQLGDGYGRPTLAAAEATELLARTEGILTDPIYTAKALAGLVATVRAGAWDGKRIVFWHAGGLPGIFEPLD